MRTNYELRRTNKLLQRENEQLHRELAAYQDMDKLHFLQRKKAEVNPIGAAQRIVEFNNDKRRRLGNVREIE